MWGGGVERASEDVEELDAISFEHTHSHENRSTSCCEPSCMASHALVEMEWHSHPTPAGDYLPPLTTYAHAHDDSRP